MPKKIIFEFLSNNDIVNNYTNVDPLFSKKDFLKMNFSNETNGFIPSIVPGRPFNMIAYVID